MDVLSDLADDNGKLLISTTSWSLIKIDGKVSMKSSLNVYEIAKIDHLMAKYIFKHKFMYI